MLFLTKFRGNVFWQPVYLIFRMTLPDVFNKDEAFPSEILGIWAAGLLAERHHYRYCLRLWDSPILMFLLLFRTVDT